MHMRNEQGGLKMIRVEKKELLETIQSNMEKHVSDYEETERGFKKHYKSTLAEMINRFDETGKIETFLTFDQPQSHEEDYQSIIDMLQMSVDDEVEITYEQFQRYVRDNWEWKKDFIALSAQYK